LLLLLFGRGGDVRYGLAVETSGFCKLTYRGSSSVGDDQVI
jgi:hypothetical protein